MNKPYDPHADFQPSAALQEELGPLLNHRWGCRCTLHGRRLFGAALAAGGAVAAVPALARDGVDVGEQSSLSKLVSAEDVENAAQMQYGKLMSEAAKQGALASAQHPQLVRLRAIAERLIPLATQWNPRAKDWRWEINLINSKQINAFCMPGGKIAFYTAILDQLQLTDDEVAMVMGHEMAHALREHARAQMGKNAATGLLAGLMSNLLGLGNAGNALLNMGRQLLTLKFSRGDETEADLVGMDLAARAGYDPRAGISLWQKMAQASKGAPPQFMSTHPSGKSRIQEIQANLPKVMPLYERAAKPPRRFDADVKR
ncbi:MAG: M48 family peptidase [Aquabacterium sp.]|nr:MAG: M48 family peptidase [Aquabacterium sp.]TAL26778.1 MAG: M48 family peptidase [Aquabacterium sp.]